MNPRKITESETPCKRRRRSLVRRRNRDGVAAVEAAICCPFIVLLMLGTLEVCAGVYLKESLTVSAFEGIRAGVRRRATADDVMDRVLEVLADRQVVIPANDGESGITITPNDFSDLEALDTITVTIVAPTAGNSLYIFDSLVNRHVTASVTMVREFDE